MRGLTTHSFPSDGLVASRGKDASLEGRLLLAASKNNRSERLKQKQKKKKKKIMKHCLKLAFKSEVLYCTLPVN